MVAEILATHTWGPSCPKIAQAGMPVLPKTITCGARDDILGDGGARYNRAMTPRELATQICATLRACGHHAYLVRGCVRDVVLGPEPADFDVATDALPARVQELFPGSVDVGVRF